MSKNIRQDILGQTPKLGDIIVYNPPRCKGLHHGVCIGFTLVGLPKLSLANNKEYVPKTGFVVIAK